MNLKGKNGVSITAITAYRISQASMPHHGEGTSYHQKHMAMSKKGLQNPNPRTQFVRDIIQFIQALQQDNKEILLMLDANEEIGSSSSGISMILSE